MIFGDRTTWVSQEQIHTQIRFAGANYFNFVEIIQKMLESNDLEEFRKSYTSPVLLEELHRIYNLEETKNFKLGFNAIPNIDDYIDGAIEYLEKIIHVYNISFDATNYRRQSVQAALQIKNDFWINAYTQRTSFGLTPIYITIGTLFAVEDAAHALISDPLTPLGMNRREMPHERFVSRLPDLGEYDQIRYIDYSEIMNAIIKSDEKSSFPAFLLHFHKFLSNSPHRLKVADTISTISLMWIISHEDAHNYLGHIHYLDSLLNASPREVFNEFVPLETEKYPSIRKAAEYQADQNACQRMVDVLIDQEFLDLCPWLEKVVEMTSLELPNENISLKERKFISLFRVLVSSIVLSLTIFQRGVILYNSDISYYPSFLNRILSVFESVFKRSFVSVQNNPDYGLENPNYQGFKVLVIMVVDDLNAIFRTILYDERVINFDKVNKNNDVIELRRTFADETFSAELVVFFMLYLTPVSLKGLKDLNLKYYNVFYNFLNDRHESAKICSKVFAEHRIAANPTKFYKIVESLEEEARAIAHFEDRL
ncbi:hypothetical protein LXM25_05690 [Dyadobacter sp. LJ53]|uniref:hypothetical protein n=1 Tax=Dyadobacter chenwenxiniae TaxID=2906456 RepID=UPI001F469C04|nr:hypothetical protein [Dyadobacter chenwenxiniae]MCF0049535.1 hypothetical protein [Dyadobacter chenwenxiniae]